MELIRILFLAFNPQGTEHLQLDQELRTIDQRIRSSKYREVISIHSCWAVRYTDIPEAILRFDPHVIHFSGHGSDGYLYFENEQGNIQAVDVHAVGDLFKILSGQIKCVIFNACYSIEYAKELSKYIDCVVGMPEKITDVAAISFSAGFYRGISWGKNVYEAYLLGCNEIHLKGEKQNNLPVLVSRDNVNPTNVFLVQETQDIDVFKYERPIVKKMGMCYFVGQDYEGATLIFYNRIQELDQTIDLILGDGDLISIYGRPGIGKSALLHEVFNNIFTKATEQTYIVFCDISLIKLTSLESIFLSCSALLDDDLIMNIWLSPKRNIDSKINALFDRIYSKKFIFVIDNFDVILDDKGFINLSELSKFIEVLIFSRNKKIVTLSRTRISFPITIASAEKPILIEQGLSPSESIKLLKAYDRFNALSYLESSELLHIALKTFGVPRALQICIEMLRNDRYGILANLLENASFQENISEKLLTNLYSNNSLEEKYILDVIALFEKPILPDEILYILEPFLVVSNINNVLSKLMDQMLIKFDLATGKFFMNSMDQDIRTNYLKLHDVVRKSNIERRIASYYIALRCEKRRWSSLQDVEYLMKSFDYRIRAGDYDMAAQIIGQIDRDYLNTWGYAHLVLKMRDLLSGKLLDKQLAIINYIEIAYAHRISGSLGNAYLNIKQAKKLLKESPSKELKILCDLELVVIFIKQGMIDRALRLAQKTYRSSRAFGDERLEGLSLAHLGNIFFRKENFALSQQYYEKSCDIAKENNNFKAYSSRLDGLALTFLEQGNLDKASELTLKALKVAKKIKYKRGISLRLNSLGIIELRKENYNKANAYLKQSLKISEQIGDLLGKANRLCNLARVYQKLFMYEKAEQSLFVAIKISMELGDWDLAALCLNNLGDIYFEKKDFETAMKYFLDALNVAEKTQNDGQKKFIASNLEQLKKTIEKGKQIL